MTILNSWHMRPSPATPNGRMCFVLLMSIPIMCWWMNSRTQVPCRVELMICEGSGNTKDNRKAESMLIANQIKELHGSYEIYTAQGKRKCSYGDMAVLLRNRTYLTAFED